MSTVIFLVHSSSATCKLSLFVMQAVRRLKSSPLTKEEQALIEEVSKNTYEIYNIWHWAISTFYLYFHAKKCLLSQGLKVFKNDWTKVCEQCVPYRDPATLSRLWRAALGIQKSYSLNSEAKAKHRRNKVGKSMRLSAHVCQY